MTHDDSADTYAALSADLLSVTVSLTRAEYDRVASALPEALREQAKSGRFRCAATIVALAQSPAPSDSLTAPQPPPVARDERWAVWPIVISHVERSPSEPFYCPAHHVVPLVLKDMRDRDAQGRAKYGVPLTAHNGRDHLVDLYQEALDGAVYAYADYVEQRDPAERESAWLLFDKALSLVFSVRTAIARRRGELP